MKNFVVLYAEQSKLYIHTPKHQSCNVCIYLLLELAFVLPACNSR